MRAAIAFCPGVNASSARSRCSSTILPAPPSRSSVASRRTREPSARSTSQSRCITSWRYGVSIRADSCCFTAPRPLEPGTSSPERTPSSTASTSPASIARPSSPGTSSPKRSTGPTIARRPASRSSRSSRSEFANRPGMRALNASSRASASSRMPIRTCTASSGRPTISASTSSKPRAALRGVVEEVLLELVEDEVELAFHRRDERDRVHDRTGRLHARGGCDGCVERAQRVVGPRVEDDDAGMLGEGPQIARDAGAQHGALADAARPVEHGQPRRDEVRDDDLALALAAEEEQRVELRVLERREALVRADGPRHRRRRECRRRRHTTTLSASASSTRRRSSSTYSRRGTSKRSTPRSRQYSTESGSGSAPTAHER